MTDQQHDVEGNEFLIFRIGEEEYGIDILKVQEIRGYDGVTRIANAPEFIKGVTNLRGVIVPILDLRIKFAVGEAQYNQQTVVIVLNIGHRVVGVVVDGVSDVLTLSPEQIKDSPDFGTALSSEFIMGLGSIEDRMLILMDIEKMMSSTEMALVDEVAA
ncbi:MULTISPECIES: chemotaxis protein CheW [Larsenimonas]|uniref:Chemotaxis protein CheW n=1 Tax=Larsenimonas suaedae TaxID=1851019 RepID=A0ABU1GT36_9GAMM|nr:MULTISPECIES: chemotaxis protein CheW [Larsenimonas]MCM2971641.1 chemotaxis protein CheW [Larsenimonas suaedae]MCM5703746.1 chemotaxis protein CheW [Larsenimonas salina]MDR5895193.1 chemotaxis protein CheW [Larsenimonas suaedae]